jgi:isoquinoline 1-oxidoreductase beta subunit
MKLDRKEFVDMPAPVSMPPSLQTNQAPKKISRRVFLGTGAAAAGGALVIGFTVRKRWHAGVADETAGKVAVGNPFDAWVHVQPDGSADLVMAQSEMGQGVYTSLPMLLADEADLDWRRVRIVQSDLSVGTGGSGSVKSNYLPLRRAGAVVRTVMIAAAARRWGVTESECSTSNGEVTHAGSGRRVGYGELVSAARMIPLPDFKTVKLKQPGQFTLIGKPMQHLDIPAKCTGTAGFGLDVRLPGMVYAVIARCPTFGGSPAKFDATKAMQVPGVLQIFEIPARGFRVFTAGGIVVVAKSTWAALQGRKALEITWNRGSYSGESTETQRVAMKQAIEKAPAWTSVPEGVGLDSVAAAKRVESVYEFQFLSHACMEPMNITAHLRGGKCEVWAPSQAADAMRSVIAKELGLTESSVTVHTTLMGGGFGRRYQYDFPTEVAQIAKHVNGPVQLVWTREDDMTHDFYRPAGMRRMRGALDAQGNIAGWSDHLADVPLSYQWAEPEKRKPDGSEMAPRPIYPIAEYRTGFTPIESAVPRAWWRSVENSFNGVAVECFTDELAHAAGEDPYRFRRRLLQSPDSRPAGAWGESRPDKSRLIAVLDLAAQKGDWGSPLQPSPGAGPGVQRGRGIACTTSYAYLAQVAEVTVEKDTIRVDRLVTVVDCGQVVNPNGARSQLEGGMLFTLSSILKEAITIKDGAVVEQNFDDYSVLRMPEAPKLETWIVDSHDEPHGLGEAAVALTGPAVANAIFAATGKRLRRMPFRMDESTA